MDLDRVTETAALFGSLLVSLLVLFIPITVGLVLIQRWLGTERLARLLGGERLLPALLKGTLLGAVTPFCGCSTIPLLLGLIRARVRFAGVAAFMLASPLLNPYILGVVTLLFGARTAVAYAGFAGATAIGLGALWELAGLERHLVPGVSPRVPRREAVPVGGSCGRDAGCDGADDDAAADEGPAWTGWEPELRAAYDAARGTLRPMVRPLLLGVTIGAMVYGFAPEGWLAGVLGDTTWWTLPLAAVVGLPLYLRGEAAFPIGAGLLAAGVGEGPMFAMVIAGMGASLPEVTILSGIFRRRLLLAFLASVLATAVLGGIVLPTVG